MMRRIEVRCCCTPTRLYGTLEVHDEYVRGGNMVRFAPVMRGNSTGWVEPLDLEVVAFSSGAGPGWWYALRFDGVGLSPNEKRALLRNIPSFIEEPE
jgi:hypothetical protein